MIETRLRSHEDLMVWQKSMLLIQFVYQATKGFPREETYGLTSQIKRAVISIPTNITEGYHRNHSKEYIQFLYIAKSSAWELQTLLQIADRLLMLPQEQKNSLDNLLTEIIKMLTSLISKLKEKSYVPAKP